MHLETLMYMAVQKVRLAVWGLTGFRGHCLGHCFTGCGNWHHSHCACR